MRRVYLVRSPWGMFVRWCAFFGGLFLLLTGVQYAARFFASAGAFLIVAGLVAVVFWVGSRLGR